MPGTIIPQWLSTAMAGPVSASPFLHSHSRIETMYTLVGFMGGSTVHFFEGIESNQRDPQPGKQNGHMLHPPYPECQWPPSFGAVSDAALACSELIRNSPQWYNPVFGAAIEWKNDAVASIVYMIQYRDLDSNIDTDYIL